MNKILPIILVIVLSGCSGEPTHYFKCDAIKEHKNEYYNVYSISSDRHPSVPNYGRNLYTVDYPSNTVYFTIENNKLNTIDNYYTAIDYIHNNNTDFKFRTRSFISSLSVEERQHGTIYKTEERLYFDHEFDRVSRELTIRVRYKVHSNDKNFGYPDGKLKDCAGYFPNTMRPCFVSDLGFIEPGGKWDKGGIAYTPFMKYTYLPDDSRKRMMERDRYTKKYKCIKRPD